MGKGRIAVIIGSGLLGSAFSLRFAPSSDICIYAAGVSNSSCTDKNEFLREKKILSEAIDKWMTARVFLYFSTCSIEDDASKNSAYVQHKIEMERLVSKLPNFIIARLPQAAGKASNPHTLLNYLRARILCNEKIVIWKNATRNIIDIDDVVSIVSRIVFDPSFRNIIVNIANPRSTSVGELVSMMENIVGKKAIVEEVDRGASPRAKLRPAIIALC